ncbi:MAG: glycerol-3-phosphate acyltransferase, partial [Clostridiaceae bacterium]|nr:glycerol-3-phosphate acyltransferase [Clostridiaceae bacterium]
MYWVLCAMVSYALGGINSAIAVAWVLHRDDIRRHGSGNAGASNMFRT